MTLPPFSYSNVPIARRGAKGEGLIAPPVRLFRRQHLTRAYVRKGKLSARLGALQRCNHRGVENLAHFGAEGGDLDGVFEADEERAHDGDAAQPLQELGRNRG